MLVLHTDPRRRAMDDVIVGVDLAEPGDISLRWAAEYCRITTQRLVGAVGFQPSQAELPPEKYEEYRDEARAQANDAVSAVAAGIRWTVAVRYGDPREVIPAVAADTTATLVVVGAHGDGGWRHLGLGTVAHHVAYHQSVPVVIVGGSPRPLERGTVVVGLDGSPGDVVTLDWALRLTKANGGGISVVFVSDPMSHSYPHPYGSTLADEAELAMRAQVARCGAGVDVATAIEVDDPVRALLHAADREDAAAVVVGRKGVGHLRGNLLGRVPAKLPFEAHRPVVIVPRASG
jgi:nucleotide-binding universal stress UspA family protein